MAHNGGDNARSHVKARGQDGVRVGATATSKGRHGGSEVNGKKEGGGKAPAIAKDDRRGVNKDRKNPGDQAYTPTKSGWGGKSSMSIMMRTTGGGGGNRMSVVRVP